jgi:hypothetical protein
MRDMGVPGFGAEAEVLEGGALAGDPDGPGSRGQEGVVPRGAFALYATPATTTARNLD